MAKKTDAKMIVMLLAFGVLAWLIATLGWWVVVIGVVGLIIYIKESVNDDDTIKHPISITFCEEGDGRRTLTETELFCDIAGVAHHNNTEQGFIGYVCSDPTNRHDPNAIAICDLSGKLIGYIPKAQQNRYNQWTNRDGLPCVGFIYTGHNGNLKGKVKVVDADRVITEIHFIKFVLRLISNHGRSYIPSEFYSSPTDRFRSEDWWLDRLSESLAVREEKKKVADKARRLADKAKASPICKSSTNQQEE